MKLAMDRNWAGQIALRFCFHASIVSPSPPTRRSKESRMPRLHVVEPDEAPVRQFAGDLVDLVTVTDRWLHTFLAGEGLEV